MTRRASAAGRKTVGTTKPTRIRKKRLLKGGNSVEAKAFFQARLERLIVAERAFILARVKPWQGSEPEALEWYRDQKIPALGNVTAESLVQKGKGHRVRTYLDAVEVGAFA